MQDPARTRRPPLRGGPVYAQGALSARDVRWSRARFASGGSYTGRKGLSDLFRDQLQFVEVGVLGPVPEGLAHPDCATAAPAGKRASGVEVSG